MPPTDEKVLEVIELTKTFRDFWGRERVKAVDALNFDVCRGEVLGLLGPNGSGKTTTVRMVLGLLFPTSGAVRLFGRSPRSVDVKKRIGYMPEESHLYPYLNAEETLDFFGRIFRLGGDERERRIDALIQMVGLNRARSRPVGQYSKGMARRLGLAQALINDPDFLILDEPTTGLDPIGTRQMKDLIITLRERGKTVLLCSHLLADVEEVCDRVCILYGGKRRAIGGVEELLTSHDQTQINLPHLDEATVRDVLEFLRRYAGEGDIKITNPTKRLEDYFLDVVEQARRERLQTAGAEKGGDAAEFLGSARQDGEKLVDELVQAAVADEAQGEPQTAAVADAGETPAAARDQVIDDLMEAAAPSPPPRRPADKPVEDAREVPSSRVRDDVLDELMTEDADEGGSRNER